MPQTALTTAAARLIAIFKATRAALDAWALADHKATLARGRKTMARAVMAWRGLVGKTILRNLTRALAGGTPAQMVDRMADWAELDRLSAEIFQPVLQSIFEASMRASKIEKGGKLPILAPATVNAYNWANLHVGKLVTLINGETKQAIQAFVMPAITQGTAGGVLARQIRPLIGLDAPRAASLAKYRAGLVDAGLSAEKIASKVDRMGAKLLRERSETIARTEAAYAKSEGTRLSHKGYGVTQLRWLAHPEACPMCVELNGQIFEIDAAEGMQPKHPRCFPGSTKILAPGIVGAYSGTYNGPILRIVFDGGEVHVTPNHLLLTPDGFARAASLRKGDQVIYNGAFDVSAFACPDNNRKPTRIDEVVAAATKSFGVTARRMEPAPEDLHGDGSFMNGDIDVIRTDGFLRGHGQTGRTEAVSDHPFEGANERLVPLSGDGDFNAMLKSLALAADRIMGGRRDSKAFLGGSAALPSQKPSRRTSSNWDSSLEKPSSDDISVNTQTFRQMLLGFSGQITPRNVLAIESVFHSGLRVFDLQTDSSMYLAEGLVVSNCECAWVVADKGDLSPTATWPFVGEPPITVPHVPLPVPPKIKKSAGRTVRTNLIKLGKRAWSRGR